MISKADALILIALGLAFTLGAYLWFTGHREEGMFAALWVPAILGFGIYFRLLRQRR
jgi:hypothetical protein